MDKLRQARNEGGRRSRSRGLTAVAGALALTAALSGCAKSVQFTQATGCMRTQDDRGKFVMVEGSFSLTPEEATAIAHGGELDTNAQHAKDAITGDHVDELRLNKVEPVINPVTDSQRQEERAYKATEVFTGWAHQQGERTYTLLAHIAENNVGGLLLSSVCIPTA
jgi:hypothetical protein